MNKSDLYGGKHILCVEIDQSADPTAYLPLTQAGYQLTTWQLEQNWQEISNALSSNLFDLVLAPCDPANGRLDSLLDLANRSNMPVVLLADAGKAPAAEWLAHPNVLGFWEKNSPQAALSAAIQLALKLSHSVQVASNPLIRLAGNLNQNFLEYFHDGVWIVDANFKTLYANLSLEKLFGYSAKEILSRPVSDFWHPEDIAILQQQMALRIQGVSNQYEVRFVHADGHTIWCNVTSTALQNERGEFIGSVALLRDISAAKQNEQINQARLRLLEFSMTHSLAEMLQATLDEAELITGSSIGFFHFLEEDQENLVLQMWSTNTIKNMCTLEGRGRHYPISQAGVWVDCVATGKPVIHNDYASLQHRKGMPEGHARIERELVVPVLRGDKIEAIMGIGNKPAPYTQNDIQIVATLADLAWDIARRIQVEENLAESERRFRSLAEIAPVGIYMTDLQGNRTFTNQRWSEITGIRQEDALKDHWTKIIHPDDVSRLSSVWSDVLKSEGKEGIEYRMVRPNGEVRWVYGKATEIKPQSGVADGWIGVIFDITQRKESESRLNNMVDEKEALLRELYHRTKNNLQVVASMVILQAGLVEEEKTLSMLKDLESKIASMALVHQKLYQSKNLASINLENYIFELVGLLYDSFNIHSDKIKIVMDLADVQVPVDLAIPCGLILNELITNAFKYAFPGSRQGEIILRLSRPAPDELLLEVSDNGIGLPEGFDPRSQTKSLGLQTILALGEHQLGGRVTFTNQDGFGCQVQFPADRTA